MELRRRGDRLVVMLPGTEAHSSHAQPITAQSAAATKCASSWPQSGVGGQKMVCRAHFHILVHQCGIQVERDHLLEVRNGMLVPLYHHLLCLKHSPMSSSWDLHQKLCNMSPDVLA